MRFCPFCSAENADDMAACQACGRRLPPLPPRRAGSRGAPPTGVSMPPRAHGTTQPPPIPPGARKTGTTIPPPTPPSRPMASVSVAATSSATGDATVVNTPLRDSVPALPPPPSVDDEWGGGNSGPVAAPVVPSDHGPLAELRNAISPGPAAERREPPPVESRDAGEQARRKSDGSGGRAPMSPNAFARSAGSGPISTDRAKSASTPPPFADRPTERPKSTSTPPPFDRARTPSTPPAFGSSSQGYPRPGSGFPSELGTQPSAPPLDIRSDRARTPTGIEPPPTRIHRPDALVDRPFTPPKVLAVPAVPEPGLYNASRYAYQFAIARWQRRGAIKQLGIEIKQDTEALDQVLGALGREARIARVEGRVFSAENTAITAAEERVAQLGRENNEVDGRKVEENSKFVDVERERNEKLVEGERMVEEAQRELQHLEAQRRSLRDKRKELDRRQKNFLKQADDHDRQAGAAPLGDQRQELRRVAESHRKEAAALEPDKQELDRRIASLERPISEATARLDAAKAELDAAKRSLNDAREGHTHRLAELDAEQKRKAREVGLAEGEIARRLVTLGTLVNLNRIEDPQFAELYLRIDRIRGAITARTTEIEKLTAEREAYDRGTLVRGVATIGGAFVALIALIVILQAVL